VGADAGGAPDDVLVRGPGARGRHERLVIEAGRKQRREQIVERPQVEIERRPAVLARGNEPIVKLRHGGARVGLGARALADPHQRVRLLRPGGEDAARTVIFEAASDDAHAVRQQRRRQRVARVARVAAAIEGERERARAVDRAALRQTERLRRHEVSPPGAAIAWVKVSRSTVT
jgi:hypothetical protein